MQPVVGAGRGGALGDQQAGGSADEGARAGADHGQGVGVAFLRHQDRGAAQRGIQGDVAEAGAGEDLEVFGQPIDRGGGLRCGDHRIGKAVDCPHDVASVRARALGAARPAGRG